MVATAAPAAALLLLPHSPPLGFDRSFCYECFCRPTQLGSRCRPAAAPFRSQPCCGWGRLQLLLQ
eukprot:14686300-Alexandrium_andersonii.AAC.1